MIKNLRSLLLLAGSCLALIATSGPARAADSLVTNGDLEREDASGEWPLDWGRSGGVTWEKDESGNHFFRLAIQEPGDHIQIYREIAIPEGTASIELTWRQRITGVVVGDEPWYMARTLLKFLDANRRELPWPVGADTPWLKETNGWEDARAVMLVPAGTATLLYSPCLFRAKAGTFDLDDIRIVAASDADTERLSVVAARERAAAKLRSVPSEKPNPAKWPKMLSVQGPRLVDTNGNHVILRGVATGDMSSRAEDPQIKRSVLVAVDEWKANTVRIPVHDDFWLGKHRDQTDGGQAYRERVDELVNLIANRGAYVILDLHQFRAPKPAHITFWRDAAARYKNHPAVLFDLFNEPHDISWDVWRDGGFVAEKTGVDESAFLSDEEKRQNSGFDSPGMQALVDAVRSTGAMNIVIAGGIGWAGDASGIAKGYALRDKNIMYSWHQYNWHTGWDRVIMPLVGKYPILVGEFGADEKAMEFLPPSMHQESPYTWLPDMFGFIQKHELNWTAWCLHPYATPRMLKDWSYEPTPYFGDFVKRALAGEKFEMKRMR